MQVYLYKEFTDSLAYGEELTRIFATRQAAELMLCQRVEECIGVPWKEAAASAQDGDVFDKDYVSISNDGGDTSYFIVEEKTVEGAPAGIQASQDTTLSK